MQPRHLILYLFFVLFLGPSINPSSMRNTREKLDLLLEYQNVPEEKKGEWLRQKGLHTEHLTLFRQELNSIMAEKADEKDRKIKELERQLKDTKRELDRKNDALAEMAAIYTLKKKARLEPRDYRRGRMMPGE